MLTLLQEKRPLKRPRLGPPDVYPQEAKQKEDELTSMNVKHGFATMPQLSDEFGTAHNSNVNASKVGAFFNLILARKEELMTLQDSGRKKQQINPKDNFWPVSPRNKVALDAWFKDLAGNKPLPSLAKKAPSFNKKEDIFVMLCENQVSMQRAAWFIKLSSAYTTAVSEAKIKKRQMPDPTTEWTGTLIKFMKDLVSKLQEHFSTGGSSEKTAPPLPNSMATSTHPTTIPPPMNSPAAMQGQISILSAASGPQTPEDSKMVVKQWNYCTKLIKYMYEESLLDRQELLNWLIDLLDKTRSLPSDDGFIKLVLPLALQYMYDFVQSERLCRKLAYIVAKKISLMFNNAYESPINQMRVLQNSQLQSGNDVCMKDLTSFKNEQKQLNSNNMRSGSMHSSFHSSVQTDERISKFAADLNEIVLKEFLSCPHHRTVILQISTILQIITIECPTALVWCGIGESKSSSALIGSPLDHLPIEPSLLPMPNRCEETNREIREQLKNAEENIKIRSRHSENKWCAEKWLNASTNSYSKVLQILDALDSHCFDRMDTSNSIETLYFKIFEPCNVIIQESSSAPVEERKEVKNEYDPGQDSDTVKILCEWAVSWQRWGEHRAMVVAWLLDKRQTDVTSFDSGEGYGNTANMDDKESISSGIGLINGLPVFQSVLMDFLDTDAPILEENASPQNQSQFSNLVHLFTELIRHDVFSHDAYLCTLISRGDLLMGSAIKQANSGMTGTGPVSNKPSPPNQGLDDDVFSSGMDFKQNMEEFDDSNVDDDLDKLLQHIKEKDQQSAMDAPDSPKDPDHQGNGISSDSPISRHFIYTKHFPLSQDDPLSQHDCNQRYILLFGVGKERDEKKHAVKKMSKEICKLFSKKFSIDVAEGGKVKKHSRSEFNFEATTNKCQNMPYFDQHVVTWQCAVTVQEMLNSFALGNSNYLPVQEHVAFLFDLMEMALNIYGLIDICIQILKELPEVEMQLMSKKSVLTKSYTTSLGLYIVGILRRYHNCLLVSPEQTSAVFEGLCKVVKHVTNPGDCSSAERCILAYLYDLYSSCSLLKAKPQSTEPFHNAYPKIKQALYASIQPIATAHAYNPQFLLELFQSPKRGGKIEPNWGRQLNEAAANRYSFVCNAIVAVCRESDNDRLNDISISCAELTACCNTLSAEWIGALQALCGSSNDPFYQDLVGQIDIQNVNIHNSLAVFTCILVARHCFSLEDFVVKIALPALGNACNGGREITPDAEAGARLSCHLLLKLFKTIEIPQPSLYSVSTSPNPITVNSSSYNIKLSCDRHLLVATHKNIRVEAVLTVLKGILVVGDTTAQKSSSSCYSNGKRSGLNTPVHPGSTPKNMDRPVDLSHILGTSDLNILGENDEMMLDLQQQNIAQNEQTSSLSDFAQHVLKQICSQEWVLERCLQHADMLCGMLIDAMLTSKQVQRLLHMICYSENEYSLICDMDQKSIIVRILDSLEQWSLRISWLNLQLMYKQTSPNPSELNNWLDTVARAAIDVFQNDESSNVNWDKPKPSIWLVAPLVSKLPSAVQGRILRVAGQVLESTNFFSKSHGGNSDEKEKPVANGRRKNPINNHPFLGLILTCLKGQDEQKEGLLTSLHTQLSQFLQSTTEFDSVGGIEDPLGKEDMLQALQIRFSLVGGMFESIQKNGTSTTDWAMLLTQLVCQGIVDLTTNCEIFTTVMDMLATLIHSTLITDSQSERDENKKLYINLMKKLKKEIAEKNNASIKFIRQLLPLSKQTTEVVSCEQGGIDTKGNKISGFDLDKKHGLRISDKQRVSVWDILEGHKNPAPLSWAWFGAVKLERKPLAYEETHRLLKYHTHSLVKPSSYYLEPLVLPPEDLEPLPEKQKDDLKADTPSSVDQSPSAVATNRGRGKGVRKPRKSKNTAVAVTPPVVQQNQPQQLAPQQMANPMNMNPMQVNMQQYQQNISQNSSQMIPQQQMQQSNMQSQLNPASQNQNSGMNFMSGAQMNQQPQQWNNYNQMQPQQFYNQQGIQMNRFERPQINTSKQALSNMLRQRHPFIANNQGNPAAFNIQQQQRQQQQQQFMRNTLRGIAPNQMVSGQGNIPAGIGQAMAQNPISQGMNPNAILPQQAQLNQPQLSQAQQTGQSIIPSGNGLINSTPSASMMNQQLPGSVPNPIPPSGGMMQQQNVGMINQGPQYNNMGQNFNNFNNQGINPQNAQQGLMGNFNQMNPQRNAQAEYLAQQRAMQANRNQYLAQAPNVTMSNMMSQGAAPPYPRSQPTGGKPGVVTAQQQQQQFQQQQRIRQQMMMQGMGQQNNTQGMGQPQSQQMGQQQTPALVAQLQRQIPNQQNIMAPQYSHQPPPY